jgi:hypothetical protein
MLQMMQKKVTEEGEKEQALHDKFMCYCQTGGASLSKSIDAAETKIPQVESDLKAAGGQKAQLASDVVRAKKDRKEAKAAMAEATAIRDKTAAAFAKESSEQKADIAAMGKAITAIEKGASGFLQTSAAAVLRRLAVSADLSVESRDELTSFLSDGASSDEDDSYEPASGAITGILKQMKETSEKGVADAAADEAASIKDFDALMAAKGKESEALTAEVESKTSRLGEVGVQLVDQAQDLADTQKALAEDQTFLKTMDSTCKTRAAEWEVRQKTRADELTALAETVKLLNDDDALDLFKKTLPSSSFLQVTVSSKEVLKRARQAMKVRVHDYRLDLISMSMRGKKVNFDKVLGMVDDMVALLKQEQVNDDKKKAYCAKEFDKAEDEKKVLSRAESDLKKAMEDEKETIASLVEDIASLEAGIKALDKAVAEATQNRKEENAAFQEERAANNAALEILDIAKNRLNKFYNPKMYKAPPPREMSESERISVNMGGTLAPTAAPGGIAGTGVTAFAEEEEPSFVQISARLGRAAPPPPPAAMGAYKKKSGESSGVISMMDLLIKDVKKENAEADFEEKEAQKDYEQFMADSKEKRSVDAKAVAEKESARAETTAKLQKHKEEHKGTIAELYANHEYTSSLHGECDWLVQNFDVRKTARASEVDALTKAKAVLSGADYSFVQTKHVHHRVHMLRH